MSRKSIHGEWSNRWIFILAATGSAVGLGNIWKFPYITGEYGGGAFVLVYLLCIAVIGIPIMMSEVLLGRRGKQSPINTMRALAKSEGASRYWQLLGWSGVVAGFLILSYYSVIAGWALAYVLEAASGAFTAQSADNIGHLFSGMLANPWVLLFWHSIFMLLTIVVVARGVRQGLEKAIRFLMPALFVLLILMVGYAMSTGEFMQGVKFLFNPDFSKLSWAGVLTAMGHAFFTLSLGMGAIMIYGSYMPHDASIAKTSILVAVADTLVALLAGLAIFPIVFAYGLEPGAGPSLIFMTLPIAFGQMPGGILFGTLFFVLLVFAAWSSAISLIEPAVAWLVENRNFTRIKAALITGISTWLLGIITVFSFNDWRFSFYFAGEKKTNGMFDVIDILTANIMLPLGGLFIAIFAAWVMRQQTSMDELGMGQGARYQLWKFLVRFVTPVGVTMIFLKAIGVL
ncbi:MAG: sodium-dependent transporter [Gammaproteobacteria bacterium]|nr:sodium-dependent transporter [Gammaproteobacteria bacterium]